jgi:hypothetical protein
MLRVTLHTTLFVILFQWNGHLLRDVIGSEYSALITEARDITEVVRTDTTTAAATNANATATSAISAAVAHYYTLFPTAPSLTRPWSTVAEALFAELYSKPVLRSDVQGGMWVTPKDCVALEDWSPVDSSNASGSVSSDSDEKLAEKRAVQRLHAVLVSDGVPVVRLPFALKVRALLHVMLMRFN